MSNSIENILDESDVKTDYPELITNLNELDEAKKKAIEAINNLKNLQIDFNL